MTATPEARPQSDVSTGVGLVGLLGLLGWLTICHQWATVSTVLGLPGPREPLSGPYAALAGLLFAGVPMVAWSLLVDKVHRRASTGIDWTKPRRISDVIDVSITKLAGLWATWAIIAALYCLMRWYWTGQYLFAIEVIGAAAIPLFLLSIPYVLWTDRVLTQPRDGAWHFGAALIGREPWEREAVVRHLRAWAVKGFFTAFMISILPFGFFSIVTASWSQIVSDPVALTRLLMELMFVIDVQIGTVGYLLTMRPLDAQIRSANPYFVGWFAALACYPPFQLMGEGRPIFYQAGTADWAYWLAGNPALLWAWGGVLVFLSGFYAWATFAFGIRFSNLTYRGVLTHGPYRFTRHPAYLSKNAFWWLSTLPFMVTSGSFVDAVRNCFFLAVVSALYFWRAKTEERHLLGEDAKYRAYFEWMARNGPITAPLQRIADAVRGKRPSLQPAE